MKDQVRSEPMTPERFEEFRACHLLGLTERHAKELFAEADRLRAELDRLRAGLRDAKKSLEEANQAIKDDGGRTYFSRTLDLDVINITKLLAEARQTGGK